MSYTIEEELDNTPYSIMHSPLYLAAILDDGAVIADIRLADYRDTRTPEEARAHAYVMAASKDLLAALEDITNEAAHVDHDHWTDWVARLQSRVIAARAAIAKAKPEPPTT